MCAEDTEKGHNCNSACNCLNALAGQNAVIFTLLMNGSDLQPCDSDSLCFHLHGRLRELPGPASDKNLYASISLCLTAICGDWQLPHISAEAFVLQTLCMNRSSVLAYTWPMGARLWFVIKRKRNNPFRGKSNLHARRWEMCLYWRQTFGQRQDR